MTRTAAVLVAILTTVTASAQRPLFDPDDFLDPRAAGGRPVLISRLVIGAGSNLSGDGFRPLGENIGYAHIATSFSWRSVQFDYKRSQMKAEDGEAAVWECQRNPQGQCVALRPTRNATPKSKDTFHAAWYWPIGGGEGGIPVMLRSRVTYSTQSIATERPIGNPTSVVRASGSERTFALDTDTWFRIAGHDVFGSLAYSETKTNTNTATPTFAGLGDRKERALTYTNRFPALSLDRAKILIRPTLAVGGISNRGGSAVNLVNPAIEIFRPFPRIQANLHVIYSPQWVANGKEWKTTHQVAVFIDRTIFFKPF